MTGYSVVRFSSCALPMVRRAEAIEALHERGLLEIKLTGNGAASPHVDFANRSMPGLGILTGRFAGVRRHGAPEDGDFLYLCMTLSGTSLASWRDKELVLSDGDAVLMTSEEHDWTITSSSSVDIAGIRLPRSAVAPFVSDLGDAVMRRIPRDTDGLRLLRKYLKVAADDEGLETPAPQRLVANHLYDLIALALTANSEGAAPGESRTAGASRLAAIKADIVAGLQHNTLNATAVAARNGITVRYLHKLFQNEGITFSEFVVCQRLERALGVLRNPLHSRRTISAIAFDLGFNDLSYFNRAFRRRYKATPTDIRNQGPTR
ncbi:helix-turn-helix domain-containing protein [Bradyrhizobium sp. ma5]|uniref:helix-turn-helix domain-containing protein n=1 Tax=Bradyrhizobium sp. ma5 TaxID=3344828 RepID=UPI0035D40BCB